MPTSAPLSKVHDETSMGEWHLLHKAAMARMSELSAALTAQDWTQVDRACRWVYEVLRPHNEAEERELLPLLDELGAEALMDQLIGDHREMWDLTLMLLAANDGGSGNNFGSDCDKNQTIFDDDSTVSILDGTAPFIGAFTPYEPLSIFEGMTKEEVSGRWRLHIIDIAAQDVGELDCWTLMLAPILCPDGGGECEGADLSVKISAPASGAVGTPLSFTMIVSNAGPSTSKGVLLSQTLPSDAILSSVALSQGAYSTNVGNGLLNCSLGNLSPGSSASVIVTIIPVTATSPTNFTSIASVGAVSKDNNLDNNQASASVLIENAKADLSVSLTDSPDPVLAGGVLTYTITVQNAGPNNATNVVITNYLPSTVDNFAFTRDGNALQYSLASNAFILNLGVIASNQSAVVVATCAPRQAGLISATAIVGSDQADPNLLNNLMTVTTTVGPAADISVTLTSSPTPIPTGGNFAYQILVSNSGPAIATSLGLTCNYPAAIALKTASASQGTLATNQPRLITGDLGTLNPGATCIVTIGATAPAAVTNLVADAAVYPVQSDPNLTNNVSVCISSVVLPSVTLISGNASLVAEYGKVNGVVDPGETVSAALELLSVGTLTATNVVVTVLTNDCVVAIATGTNSYGTLKSGDSISQTFKFTATSAYVTNVVVAVRVSADNAAARTNTYSLPAPTLTSFTNSRAISIPELGKADPYPSEIDVSGVQGSLTKVAVTLNGFTHTFVHDVNILLVGPGKQGVALLAHVADYSSVAGATIVFDDDATQKIPADGGIDSGTYQPSVYGTLPDFSPAVSGPYSTNLISLAGPNVNGQWLLYVVDDADGEGGSIAGGWQLQLTTVSTTAKMADLRLSGAPSVSQGVIGSLVSFVYSISNSGPDKASLVGFTNTLSSGLAFASVAPAGTISGQTYTASFGPVLSGATFQVTNTALIVGTNILTATAAVGASELDLNPSNNVLALATFGMPQTADLTVTLSGSSNVVARSSATCQATIINNGPSGATNVLITNLFPSWASISQAPANAANLLTNTISYKGASWLELISRIASIPSGSSVNIQVGVLLTNAGYATNIALAGSDALEPLPADNIATNIITVIPQGPSIVAGDVTVAASGLLAGAVKTGQTINATLSLVNIGTGSATSVSAKLLNTSVGVAAVSGSAPTLGSAAIYGDIAPFSSASAQFALKITAAPGETVTLYMDVYQGPMSLGQVSYTFLVSGLHVFNSSAAISIPDSGRATPYPSTLLVSNLSGSVTNVSVTLNNLTHSYPGDLKIALVGPGGQTVVLTTNLGGANGVTNVTLTFNGTNTTPLPAFSAVTNGVYEVCGCGSDLTLAGFPVPTSNVGMEAFSGVDPEGTWSLYVYDAKAGDKGAIAGGWTLTLDVVANVATADIAISAQAAFVGLAGQDIHVVIVVTNKGPSMADNVNVVSSMGSTLINVGGVASQGFVINNSASQLKYNLGTIPAGASASLTNFVRSIPNFTNGHAILSVYATSDVEDDYLLDNSIGNVGVDIRPPASLSVAPHKAGFLMLTLTGATVNTYTLQYTTNLASPIVWQNVTNITVNGDAAGTSVDLSFTNSPYRYYRAILVK